MPFAHERFGGYCNITHCCKSHHKTTVKFLPNPIISFPRKSTRKDPPAKSAQNQCPTGILPSSECPYVVKQPSKNYVRVTTVKSTIVLVQRNLFNSAKIPRRGYRLKISGTSLVCNECRSPCSEVARTVEGYREQPKEI